MKQNTTYRIGKKVFQFIKKLVRNYRNGDDIFMEICGILIVDKPKDCSSNNVVNKVKKLLNTKVGHTGTLDPNATGVLPLLLGKGTKFSKYLINHDKKYIATLQLGTKTTTADIEGEIVERMDVDSSCFDENNVTKCLNSFLGKQIQTPPIYSAIKINGKKLYEYARNNIEIEIPKRSIEIYSIGIVDIDLSKKVIEFEVECSKGTYIRSLCEDIAKVLGTVGYMKDLRRVRAGDFDISNSVSIKDIEENWNNDEWLNTNIITLEKLLSNKDKIFIKDSDIDKFYNGVKISSNNRDGVYPIYVNNKFIGSGVVKNNTVKRDVLI